jgi:hypothetical protein
VFARARFFTILHSRGKTKWKEGAMVRLELTDDEARILQSVIDNYRSHLEVEIHRTEKRDFRQALEKREEFLVDILQRLKRQAA